MSPILRPMTAADRDAVAELICISTNHWYQTHGRPMIFSAGDEATTLFFDVYESLDPGCGLVAEHPRTHRLMGSCFYRIRPTHCSLGIMNVHPNHYGKGVAAALLEKIISIADQEQKPLRLVSSAMNLDSFSLYTRHGFVPRLAYQDMFLAVPKEGLSTNLGSAPHVRSATAADVPLMAELELAISGIRRDKDYQYFIDNATGNWHVSVASGTNGKLDGFLASCGHPACNMVGPGVARTETIAASLLLAELNQHKGRTPVFLVPVECDSLVKQCYAWGAKNCELHFSQIRGAFQPFNGVNLPTFLPESA